MNIRRTRGNTWELAWREPGAATRSMAGFKEDSGHAMQAVEPASAGSRLILLIDDTMTVRTGPGALREVRSFLAGPRASPAIVDRPRTFRGIEVNLSVASAIALARAPLGELDGSIIPLDDLHAGRASELHDRLSRARGWVAAFDEVDRFLQPCEPSVVDERLHWAWEAIRRSSGQVRVGSIAEELGWSRRHLASTFERNFGIAPKVAARLFRFERATALLTGGTPPAETAAVCGYFDQAHMHRDFNLFDGRTPGQVGAGGNADSLDRAWPTESP